MGDLIHSNGRYPIELVVGLVNENFKATHKINSFDELKKELKCYRTEINSKMGYMIAFHYYNN